MRILFISAFYPPHVIGGWEQLVRDVNERLQARGHQTHVLTSQYGVDEPVYEVDVSRLLSLESDLYHYQPLDFLGYRQRLEQNLAYTRQTIASFAPDVVFVHVMFNLSQGIPWIAEQSLPGRVVYYVANDWPHAPDPHTAYWQDDKGRPLLQWFKRLIAPLPMKIVDQEQARFQLQFERVLCVSEAVRQDLHKNAGIDWDALHIVYNGVETDTFVPLDRPPQERGQLKLLYAGSLVNHKGVHTAVAAMEQIDRQGELDGIELSIVGSGHPDYEARLQQMVRQAGLGENVHFLGRVPRSQMPAVLQSFDVLLFPSIWEEPLSRMMQEAMATGLVVVGTLTGGSGELLVEDETGLTFPPDDANTLAQRILDLKRDPELLAHLSQNGRDAVLARFDIRRMIDEIEFHLEQAIDNQSFVVREQE